MKEKNQLLTIPANTANTFPLQTCTKLGQYYQNVDKHNCKMAFPLSHVCMSEVVPGSTAVDVLNVGRFISTATTELAVIAANQRL